MSAAPVVDLESRRAPKPRALAQPILTRAGLVGRLRTMAGIGVRMMFHDWLKLAGTLFGVVFAVLLGNFQMGTFLALLGKNRMFVENAQVDVWVTPPGTRQFQTGNPLNDTHLNRARATKGVAWAEPLVLRTAQLALPNGGSEPVSLVGTRAPRFAGGPWNLLKGDDASLLVPNGVIFEDAEREKFGGLNLGSVRELSGHKVQVVGFTWGLLPFAPAYAFAEQETARAILKEPADKHTFIMVGVEPGADKAEVRARLQEAMGDTKVMTRDEYLSEILKYILTETQIGFSFGTSTFMGLLVGLITVALSMFSSVIDNMRQFGTLKAIGSKTFDLALLLFTQAIVYALVGSLIGLGAVAGMVQGMRNPQLTPVLMPEAFGITVVLMLGVCLAASLLALFRLYRLEPAMVFR
ncbi:MAG: ABC transporter permease [Myxococcaceae bacterium]|jgi:putative ABC transport system permease protein|nr:ABC transporter permease [Myxococcaceae bacterium]